MAAGGALPLGRRGAHPAPVPDLPALTGRSESPRKPRPTAPIRPATGTITTDAIALRIGEGQAVVSQRLRILRMVGLVDVERAHGCAHYRLARDELRALVRCSERCGEG